MKLKRIILTVWNISLLLSLSACFLDKSMAPVTDGWRQSQNVQGVHYVEKGDTLYSIAWRYGLDYRQLAKYNHISPPYAIHTGQTLQLNAIPNSVIKKPAVNKPGKSALSQQALSRPVKLVVPIAKEISSWDLVWVWPANGQIIQYFSVGGMNKGIDVAGHAGDPIKAAAAGKIVYCGNGLRGYGDLIIIKHNDEFLSAYAHNRKLLVREGQAVKAGEVIAEMGNSEASQVMLHFEIRRAGKPIDPLNYLPKR